MRGVPPETTHPPNPEPIQAPTVMLTLGLTVGNGQKRSETVGNGREFQGDLNHQFQSKNISNLLFSSSLSHIIVFLYQNCFILVSFVHEQALTLFWNGL